MNFTLSHRKILWIGVLIISVGISAFTLHTYVAQPAAPDTERPFVPGVVIVGAKKGVEASVIEKDLRTIGIGKREDIADFGDGIIIRLRVSAGREQETIAKLFGLPWVKYADVDHMFFIPDCSKGPC